MMSKQNKVKDIDIFKSQYTLHKNNFCEKEMFYDQLKAMFAKYLNVNSFTFRNLKSNQKFFKNMKISSFRQDPQLKDGKYFI